MELSSDVIVLGQLVDYKSGIFGTTTGLAEKFGTDRVQDFPVAEAVMTSTAIGAAATGLRPVIVHQRLDFMLYSLDAIVNWMSLWRFKSGGKSNMPVTIQQINTSGSISKINSNVFNVGGSVGFSSSAIGNTAQVIHYGAP